MRSPTKEEGLQWIASQEALVASISVRLEPVTQSPVALWAVAVTKDGRTFRVPAVFTTSDAEELAGPEAPEFVRGRVDVAMRAAINQASEAIGFFDPPPWVSE